MSTLGTVPESYRYCAWQWVRLSCQSLVLILAVALLGIVPPAFADWDGQWQKLENDAKCMIWNDNTQRGHSVDWSGLCANGQADGPGIAVRRYFESGNWKQSRFEGTLEGGKAQGQGTWIGPRGESYKGEWKDGRRDGQGIAVFSNGDRYEGTFRNGVPDGRGIYVWSDGDRYDGEFRASLMHGYGLYIYGDGSAYEGGWAEGVKAGRGQRTWSDGSQFDGTFVADNPHGDGMCRNAAGEAGACRFLQGEFMGWE